MWFLKFKLVNEALSQLLDVYKYSQTKEDENEQGEGGCAGKSKYSSTLPLPPPLIGECSKGSSESGSEDCHLFRVLYWCT